ncbi:MAG: hypothetical protein FJ267_01750 [Planctomycetes bacterium]|nr:hypothetical protein [Planctomycetota bacterium]
MFDESVMAATSQFERTIGIIPPRPVSGIKLCRFSGTEFRKRTLANATHEGRFDMFEKLLTRSQMIVSGNEVVLPIDEQSFAKAALARIKSVAKRAASFVHGITYLSGPSGYGKSLLVRQAIRDSLRQRPKLKYLLASANELADLLAHVDEEQSLADAIEQFSQLDVLICEDIHRLEGRPDDQDRLFSLIDSPTASGTRIVLTSLNMPGELKSFSQRWISRCHGGLCASIPRLSLNSRRNFIAQLALEKHVPIVEPVEPILEWLALRWPDSPLEVVSAMGKLSELCREQMAVVDVPFLERSAFPDAKPTTLSFDTITTIVANEFGFEPTDLRSRSRQMELIVPRQCAMYLARELTGRPLDSIGTYFGERTHTTVSHCLSRLKQLMPQTPTLREQVQRLRKRLAEMPFEDCA